MNRKLKQHLFEIEIYGDIINVFTVTFDQLNSKIIIERNHTDSKTLEYCCSKQ